MKLPSMPRKGYPVADHIREIINYIRASKIVSVQGGTLKETPNGTTIAFAKTAKTKTQEASAQTHPFQISDASTTTPAAVRVHVLTGNVSSNYGWNGPPSNMTDPDTITPLYLTVSATGWVCLKITIDAGATDEEAPTITDVIIEYLTTIPADSATVARLVIGKVTLTSGAITSISQNVKSHLIHGLAYEAYAYPDYWKQRIGPISPSL